MATRRQFLGYIGGATAALVAGDRASFARAAQSASSARREVRINGRRVRTIDVHAHCYVLDAYPLVKDQPWASGIRNVVGGSRGLRLGPDVVGPERIRFMDGAGVDTQVLSINPYWYTAERDLARSLMTVQNKALAAVCAAHPNRFLAFASVAMQYPDLAAEQLEEAVKQFGLVGAGIACNVRGLELSDPSLDPFWKKAEELGVMVFLHPQNSGRFEGRRYPKGMDERLGGHGSLDNVIGHPLETTIALAHMIFEGTLDKFPGLKLCGGHGGGFISSYIDRFDASCVYDPSECKPQKKKPSDYFRDQIYCDSKVFSTESLRHLVAQFGASQIVMGTDHPAPWPVRGVDQVLETASLSDAEKEAILGGNLIKLFKLPA